MVEEFNKAKLDDKAFDDCLIVPLRIYCFHGVQVCKRINKMLNGNLD